jgi:membrane-associated phospholipid phosphatase
VSLRDEFANAEQVTALQLVREGVIDPADVRARSPRPRSAARRLWMAEPWVRHTLAVQELLAPLTFASHPGVTEVAQEMGLGFRGHTPYIRLLRPPPDLFEAEVAQVLAYADLRMERTTEILSQVDGQWAHWCSILPMRPDRTPHTLALLTVALQWVITVELRFKHGLGCPRPVEWSPQVQPCITTPGHGSFPMGHAVQAFLVAGILQSLRGVDADDPWGIQLTRTAFRIAINRVVAGLHFPVDLVAGLVLGQTLVRYVLRMAHPAEPAREEPAVVFDPRRYAALGPLGGLHSGADVMRTFEEPSRSACWAPAPLAPVCQASAWAEMWRAAAQEWQEVRHGT